MAGGGGITLPGDDSGRPGIPNSFQPIVWEEFSTLNTKPMRPAIAPGEMFWCDGWMPLGPSNLRTLPGTGAVLYSAPAGQGIVWFQFFNIADTEFVAILLTDGSMVQVNPTTAGTTQMMVAGTIQSPSTIIGFSQWGSKYLLISKDQDNGYFIWDGTNLYKSGTLSPQVDIDNAGSNYTSTPTITLYSTGSGGGATLQATVLDGSVTQVVVTNPGSGWTVDDFVAAQVTGGGSDDQALATAVADPTSGGVTGVVILSGGNQYTARASVGFIPVDGNGSGAQGSIALQNGTITQIAMLAVGQGYTQAPTVVINDPGIPGNPPLPGGNSFNGVAQVSFGQIVNLTVVNPGSGYVSKPTVKIIGDGTGASFDANIVGGQVVDFTPINLGSGYTKALAIIQDGNNAANVSPFLMPFGVSGTAIETYQARVWVSNGASSSNIPPKNRVIFSAPQSAVDFGDGGGAFESFDSFLRVGYHSMKQANGFLYLIGDSSVNYISGVTTTSSGSANVASIPITTFSNQNTDPQIGSPWPSSVQVFSRNVVFANQIGIFATTGGAVQKISIPLDGFYNSGNITGPRSDFSSAIATIFGVPVYMLLLSVVDQFTGQLINKLLMWDGKRLWTSQQDRNLTYIAAQELNSVLTAWGTDGTSLFPLFQNPTTCFNKVVQSKLYPDPGYFLTKTARSLSGIVSSFTVDEPLTITIDNETALGTANALQSVLPSPTGAWINANDVPVSWVNATSQPVIWGAPGLDVFGPLAVGQAGRMQGFTVQTSASDVALLSLMLSQQIYATNL
jgi:hypothetical protein